MAGSDYDGQGWEPEAAGDLAPGGGSDLLDLLEATAAAGPATADVEDAASGDILEDLLDRIGDGSDGPAAAQAEEAEPAGGANLGAATAELAALAESGADPAAYADALAGLADCALQAGEAGLADLCMLLHEALERPGAAGEGRRAAWARLLGDYVEGGGAAAADALVAALCEPAIDAGVSPAEADALRALLGAEDAGAPPATAVPAPEPEPPAPVPEAAGAGSPVQGPAGPGHLEAPEAGEAPSAGGQAPSPGEAVEEGDAGAPSGLAPGLAELLELLRGELEPLAEETGQVVLVATEHTDEPVRRAALARLEDYWSRFAAAAGVAGLPGLEEACRTLAANLAALAEQAAPLPAALAAALGAWPARVAGYLDRPGASDGAGALATDLADAAWPAPLDPPAVDALIAALQVTQAPEVEAGAPARARTATPEDVSLELPPDVDGDLLDAMLQELPGQTESLSQAVQRLQTGASIEDLALAQRVAHTLKGAGNTVGVRGIAVLTHALEDIFLALKEAGTMPAGRLAESLLAAVDCLEGMSEALLGGGEAPGDALPVLQDMLDWAGRIEREGVPGPEAAEAPPAGGGAAPRGAPAPEGPAGADGPGATEARPSPGRAEAGAGEAADAVIRVPASLVEDLLSLVGESMILTTQVRERVRRAREQMAAMQGQFGLLKQLGHDLEELVDVSDLRGSATSTRGERGFDALELDEYSELHTHSRRLVEAATDARELGRPLGRDLADLEDMLVTQERLDRETQDMVLRTRMVAVKAVFPRLQRAVRQVCRLTGKQANLELSGGGTLIDSDILGDVADALMHLLRNAVDHGIEAPERRAARGKEAAGSIRVDFGREGNQILIRCADDGGGLDHEAIRGAAVEQSLVPDGASLGDEDLKRLVLRASFSTRREVSQTSGRGIGLDAVHGRVSGLGGSVTLESEPGRGLAVELRLPVTLISSHALLVRAGRHVVAVANRGVTRILPGGAGELRTDAAMPAYHTGDEAFPAVGLGTLLDTGADARESARGPRPVLLVQGDDGVTAVLAEALLDSRDLVVKPLGEYLPKRRGLVGATILGDGAVAPVLDLPELLRTRDAPLLDDVSRHGAETGEVPPLPTALVVDDSLSARRALAQCMEDAGYRVRVARDGVEAAEIAAASRPDIVLADLEMPRMNGIELVAHLRARDATRMVPAIMVTSRSTAKHRRQAEEAGVDRYLVKPFSDDVLLDHVRELTGGR